MADIRIKDLPTTASLTSSDDFIAIDGTANGTRKLSAATPAFLTSVTTPSLTSPASTNLTLGTGSYGTALTVASATGAATFAGAVSVGTGAAVGGATAGAGGLAFPASAVGVANANTLDDYEEGTWTPAFTSTGATFAYAEQTGYYVKVGSLVTLQMRLKPSSVTGTTGNATAITGFPFPSANLNADSTSAGAVGLCDVTGGLAMSIGNAESTNISLWNFGTINQPTALSLDGKYFNATISYRTA